MLGKVPTLSSHSLIVVSAAHALGADGDTNVIQYLHAQCEANQVPLFASCAAVAAIIRVLCIALMLGANALMLNFFVKGLHETDSLTATVTSASVNFMLSAAGGFFFFHEHLPLQWFLGATLILVGMACLLHGDSTPSPSESATAKEKQN
ncbi:hypothetical protein FI667_g13256, partial [Globisporangium splendens]